MRRSGSPPPYYPSSSETDPLIGLGKPSRRRQYAALIALLTAMIVIFALVVSLNLSNDPLDPDARDRIRKEWDIERSHHQEEVLERINTHKRWRLEDDHRINLREQWGAEEEEHNREVKERQKRNEEEENRMREQWRREMEEHNHQMEVRKKREEEEKKRTREQWGREVEEHEKDVERRWRREEQEKLRRREQWGREVEEHKHEVEERRKHEEEERLKLNMFWTDPEPHTCTTFATREYTARLVNVPSNYDRRVEACMATKVQIHGTEYTPKWCEDHGPNNVIGHWEVNQHEPDCASYWSRYKDIGCMSRGSGQRRIEHYLENLPSGGDWKEFCATTPVSFRGMRFMGAEFCFQKNRGTYGHWVFDDESCN